jgi:hypothetical protein
MAFSKAFPRRSDKSVFPKWEDVELDEAEEKEIEEKARQENIRLFKQCLDDANKIIRERGLKPFQNDLVKIAITLFEKQSSHTVYWKERSAKEKAKA